MDNFGVKLDGMYHTPWSRPVSLSPIQRKVSIESQATDCTEMYSNRLVPGQKVNISLQRQAVGAEREARYLHLENPADTGSVDMPNFDVHAASLSKDEIKCHMMSSRYENGLFSSSLSELFSRNLISSSNSEYYGHSIDAIASHYEEEEPLPSLEEIEAQTIGNLLPDDDDLFSGVTGGLEQIGQSVGGDDMEDLDFFNSIGGMDLEDENSSVQKNSNLCKGSSNCQLGASNISGGCKYPSRTLFVRNISNNIEDSELLSLFEQYGDIHTLYTACKHRGFVMIAYYDIRAAQNAMKALQSKLLRSRNLDIHYSIPKDYPSEKDVNQGTLVVLNLDSAVSNDELNQIFGVYGEIKAIHETSHKSDKKCIDFYDTRAAEAAHCALDQSEIAGRRIKLELSRPGRPKQSSTQRLSRGSELDKLDVYPQQSGRISTIATGASGTFSHGSGSYERGNGIGTHAEKQIPAKSCGVNTFNRVITGEVPGVQSLLQIQSPGNQIGLSMSRNSLGQTKCNYGGMSSLRLHSLPDYHDGLANAASCTSPVNMPGALSSLPLDRIEKAHFSRIGTNGHSLEMGNGFGSSGNESSRIPGPYSWTNSNQQDSTLMWTNSFSCTNGVSNTHSPSRRQGIARRPSHAMNSFVSMSDHHVGSAPAINLLWDRQNHYPVGSPEPSGFHQGSLGNMRLSGSPLHRMECMSHDIFPHVAGNCIELPIPSRNVGLHPHQQRCMVYPTRGQVNSVRNSIEHPNGRPRGPKNDSTSLADKKQYELDIGRILRGEDTRTTLMIKNIPNKYTSKMLMAAIDEHHRGTYDFIYLPIDFKNKCNVGYAFINMMDSSNIIPFFETFSGKKWEKFNSEKVASLAYGRIQGKTALVAHFQNSSLMNEDKRCRPILFHTEGPNAGDQVPFPMGVNARIRPGKVRPEYNNRGSPTSSINEDSSNPVGSCKESE